MATKGTAKVAVGQGPGLELVKLGATEVWVPASALRALKDDGELGELTQSDNGELRVEDWYVRDHTENIKWNTAALDPDSDSSGYYGVWATGTDSPIVFYKAGVLNFTVWGAGVVGFGWRLEFSSDFGTTFPFTLPGYRVDGSQITQPYTIPSGEQPTYFFIIPPGINAVRVVRTTIPNASNTVNYSVTRSTVAELPASTGLPISGGRVAVESAARGDVSGTAQTIGAVNAAAVEAVIRNGTANFEVLTGFTGTGQFEVSFDGGTVYRPLAVAPGSSAGSTVISVTNPASNTYYEAAIPPGATHLRLRASAWTATNGSVRIHQSSSPYEPSVTVSGAVNTSSTGLGGFGNKTNTVQTAAHLAEHTTTSLASAGVYTGSSQDAHATTPGSMGSSGWTGGSATVIALSDVAGTLEVQVSRDGTQWLRYRAPVATVDTGAGHVAEFAFSPPLRYYRLIYTNGASAQTRFNLSEMRRGD